MVSEGAPPVAGEATERSAAVNKIEEKRKLDDFIGYRKRGTGPEYLGVWPEKAAPELAVCEGGGVMETGKRLIELDTAKGNLMIFLLLWA